MRKFFRRSKKSTSSTSSSAGTGGGKKPFRKDSGYTQEDFERDQYRMYNPRLNGLYNPVAERRPAVYVPWVELPGPILERIFGFVCPHATDETYETCEQSAVEDACMLCDLRDIAHAGLVCKRWRVPAVRVMYRSIRIDAVHYCEREIDLSEQRRRRSRFDRNGVPEDPASARLRLLCRTLREDPTRLGKLVQYFKTPYMLRESKTSDLARTIAVLPNLRYVDLPEGLFTDDPMHTTLKLEVQARCKDLRKMTYNGGSEATLEALARGNVWTNMEVLEIGNINMDPIKLVYVLAALPNLRALKVNDTKVVGDDIFREYSNIPPFPALEELILTDTPRVTTTGLLDYLARSDTQSSLKALFLTNTGVLPWELHEVLATAPSLEVVSITEQVDQPFPTRGPAIPPLTNWALQTLRFEITSSPSTSPYSSVAAGYYDYLATSLFAGGLPRLTAVYARDQNFPDMLVGLPPPLPGFAGGRERPSSSGSMNMFNMGKPSLSPSSTSGFDHQPRFSSNNPFAAPAAAAPRGPGMLALNQTLEVFTKGDDDLNWGSTRMDPFDSPGVRGGRRGHHRSGSSASGRPLSSYGLAAVGAGWETGGGARRSVMMGNGTGGFLAVPGGESPMPQTHGRRGSSVTVGSPSGGGEDLWPRPSSSAGKKAAKKDGLWY